MGLEENYQKLAHEIIKQAASGFSTHSGATSLAGSKAM